MLYVNNRTKLFRVFTVVENLQGEAMPAVKYNFIASIILVERIKLLLVI